MVNSINSNFNYLNYGYTKSGINPVNFGANHKSQPNIIIENDSFESSNPSKKERKKKRPLARIGIGLAVGVATLLGTMTLISKGQTKVLTKLYKEKMVFKELPENIKFKEAKTIDEAIKFSKEVLGIEKIDERVSLEALNYANKGIVDVSNANKGKLFIPKEVFFVKSDKNWIASVNNDIKSKNFGTLTINERYFTEDWLDQSLNKILYDKNKKKIFNDTDICVSFPDCGKNLWFKPNSEYYKKIQKFYKSPKGLTINEKRDLYWGYKEAQKASEINYKYTPNKLYKNLIEKIGEQKYSLKEFEKLDLEKQKQILAEILNNNRVIADLKTSDGLNTIYHEMGHLQDFAKNLKDLDLKLWDFDLIKMAKESWQKAKDKVEKGIESEKNQGAIRYIDNRWGGKTYDGYSELLQKNPKKFKEYYPDLYEHLTNKETQNIAGQVSWYAQTSIGEFIAEVYAGLIQGKKFSNEVINLYKKYGGPLLPNM